MRGVVPAAMVALVVGAVACGSDGDSSSTGQDGVGSSERQIRATLDRMGAAMERRDARAACAIFTADASRRLAAGLAAAAPAEPGERSTCEDAFGAVLRAGTVIEDPRPRVVSVRVQGDRASVTADVSHAEGRQTATLVRSGDGWRVQEWFGD